MSLKPIRNFFSSLKREREPVIRDEQITLHTNLTFAGLEAYKLLRANVCFMLAAKQGIEEHICSVIGVTSAIRGEGKSTTAINLAYTLAEAGHNVLLIDGDMRLPSIGKKMEIDNAPGLSDALLNTNKEKINIRPSDILDNWYILPAGNIPPNPSELLASERFKRLIAYLQTKFDYIVLDLPPVDIVSDALVVSPIVDGIVLVVRENYTERREVSECVRQMKLAGSRILGIVLNDVNRNASGYQYYKKYGRNKQYSQSKYQEEYELRKEDTDTSKK